MSRRRPTADPAPRGGFLRRPAALLLLALVAGLCAALSDAGPALSQGEPQPPAAPGGLQVSTEVGSLGVDVDWADVDGATRYVVRWRTADPGGQLNAGKEVAVSEAGITVAGAGAWVVRVQACNDAGCGKPSARRFTVAPAPEPEPTPAPEPEPVPPAVTVSVQASATAPFAGDEVTFSADIAGAPDGETPAYRWALNHGGDFWIPAGSNPTFSYLPHQAETTTVRVTVTYPSGAAATSGGLSVTWRAFVPKPQLPLADGARSAVDRVSVSIGFDEDASEGGRPARLVALVSNLPDGETPRYRWEANLGGRWWTVGTARALPWSTSLRETIRYRVTVFYGDGESVTSDALALAWAGGRATRDVTAAATSAELISNDGQADFTSTPFEFRDRAQGFTTGSHSAGYKLTSVELNVVDGGSSTDYSVEILNDNGFGKPGTTTVGTLTALSTVTAGLNEFTGDVDLDANTTYHFVVDMAVGSSEITARTTQSDDEDSGGAAGWSIADVYHWRLLGDDDSASNWRNVPQALEIVINGYAKPITLIGNSGQTNDEGQLFNTDRAQAFTTGSNSTGYNLASVQIVLSVGGSPGHAMKIMNDDGSGKPGTTTVGTLTSPTTLTTGLNEFTGDVALDANTTYHVVMDLTAANFVVTWWDTTANAEDSGGAAGWSIGDVSHWRNADDSNAWASHPAKLKIVVNGSVNPPLPTLDSAEIDRTELVLTFAVDLDTASGTAAGAFEIKVDGGAAQAATAITIAGKTVTLTVPRVTPGQTVTVSYTKPATNPLKGADETEAPAFTDQAVTNNTVISVLISNNGQSAVAGSSTSLGLDQAQSFRTGSNSEGYKLTSVEVSFISAGAVSNYTVKIMSDSSGSPGSTEVGTLTTLSTLTAGLNEFTGDVDLDANTTYYVVFDVASNNGSRTMHLVASDNEDSGGAAGWSIGNAHHSRNLSGTLPWNANASSHSLKIVVNGYAIERPVVDSAEVDGTELVLTFDQDLDTASGTAAGAFTIKVDGGAAQAATAITIADRTVTLTVPAVTAGQRVTVSYTKPATNPLKGANETEVNGFTDQAVTNNTVSALIGNTGQRTDANAFFNRDLAQAFTTGSNNTGYTLTSVELVIATGVSLSNYSVKIMSDSSGSPGSTEVGTLTTLSSVTSGLNEFSHSGTGIDLDADTTYYVVLDLTANSTGSLSLTPTNDEDSGGAAGWSIGDSLHSRNVDDSGNWTTSPRSLMIIVNGRVKTPATTLDSAEIDRTKLVLTFDGDLDTASGTAAGAFTIKADGGAAKAATAIAIDGKTVTLTVPAVTPGQTVTVSYTKPETNPLKGTDETEAAAFTDQAVTNNTRIFVLIANDGQPHSNSGSFGSDRAQAFTTGSNSAGYRVNSLKLGLALGGSPAYNARIAWDSGDGPGARVANLEQPSSLTTGFNNVFMGPLDLLPSTTYYFYLDSTANGAGTNVHWTNGDDENAGGAPGWSIADGHRQRTWNSGGTWNSSVFALQIIVDGYLKSAALDTAEIDGTELVLTFDGDLDTASATAAGAFTIRADGGAAQAATAIAIAGKTVTLTVPAVAHYQTVTVSYTKPDTNPLEDSDDQPVEGFTDRPVTYVTGYSTSKLVSNLGLGADSLLSAAFDITTLFTTGTHSDGYKLSAVEINFDVGTGAQPTYNVELWSMLANVPATKLATFDTPATLTDGTNRFTLSTAHDLSASTTYVIVYDQTSAGTSIRPTLTASNDEESGKAAGWSIADRSSNRLWSHTSANWGQQDNVLKLALYGQPKEPATSALIGNNSVADSSEFGFEVDRAQPFTTGANSAGYRLKSVQLAVKTAGSATNYKVKIATDSGAGPGDDVATLENPSSLTVGLNSFTGDVDLAPNTTYYIVTDFGSASTAKLKRTSSNDDDSGGATGWSLGDRFWARWSGSAGAWGLAASTDVMKVVVNGYAKPTSSTATADAGEDQTVQTGATVTLDGSGSATTKAGATLTYAWTQASGPTVTLSDATAQQPTFTAPTYRTDYVFSLTVNDGDGLSVADTVTIAVRPPLNPATAPCQIPDDDATVDATVLATPTVTASAVTWGATTTGGAGTAHLYFCSPDGTREHVGKTIAAPTTVRKQGLNSGTRYWVGALKTRTSDSLVSWSGWKAVTTSGGASIVAVQIVSTPRWDDDDDGVPETYGLGDKIHVAVIWSQNVRVTGAFSNVRLRLDVGSDDSDLTNSRQVANAAIASGTRVRFEYTVAANHEDADGVWVQTASAMSDQIVFLTGGAIIKNAADGTNVQRTKSGLPTTGDPKHKVDYQYASTAPTFPNATETLDIDENSAEGDTVGTVTATDADGDTLYYSLAASGDHTRFTIVESGAGAGTIKVGPGQNFDFETAPNSYTVTVRVTDREDSDGNPETPPTPDASVVVTINVTDVDEPPGAPTVTAVTGVSTTSVTVTWTAPSDTGAEAITDYDLRYYAGSAEPTDAADWIEEGETDGHTHTGTATTATITGLAEGTTHQFQVRAEGEGEGDWSAAFSGATLEPAPAPRNLWAQSGAGAVYLHWTNPNDNSITKYQQRQSTDGGTTWTAWTDIAMSNANTIRSRNFSLTNGTYYDFELRSVHAIGTSKTGAIGVAPNNIGVSGTTSLSASAADGQVTLTWSAVPGATRYRVKHRAAGGSWGSWSSALTSTTHTVSSLTNGTTYRFEVQTGQSGSWNGSSAIVATPTPRAAAPGNFTALPGNQTIMLSWDNPGDSGITTYQVRVSDDGGATWDPDWGDITGSDDTTTTHTLSNLTNGTTYTVELRASRGTVAGAVSSASATPNLPPAAPSGLSSTAGDGQVDLSWTNPNDNQITKYQYRVSDDSGATWNPDWTDIASSGATTTSYQVTGLTNDTAYTIQVRAARSGPLYGPSAGTTATPRPTTPAAPASFAATAGDGEVELAWTDPSNSQITEYQVRQKPDGGSWTAWAAISGSSATTTSHTVTPLTNDTGYTFEVRARAGTVTFGPASSATATPRPTPPAAPGSFSSAAFDGRVRLFWADPSDSLITRYQIRQSTDGGTNWTMWAEISGSDKDTVAHEVTGLTNDTTYTFEVRARRGTVTHGPASSVTVTPRPTLPPAPTNLRADVGDTEITLRWNDPNDTRISLYQYRQSDDGGTNWNPDWTDITGSDKDTTSHTVTGLTNDTEYKFEVRARRGTVTHGTASSVTQTPRPPAPPAPSGLTADPGNAKVTLDWTNPADTLISVYQYRQSTDGGATWSPDWTDIASSDKDTITHELTGLTNDTTYTFEVRSRRGTTTTGPASRVSVTPKAPPPAPRGLWANPSTGQIDLKWANPNDSTITKYQFRQKAGSGSWNPDWTDIASSSSSTTSLTRGSLTDGTTYELEVRAVRGKSNNGSAAAIGATPNTGVGPGTLSATASDGQVTLSWGAGASTVTRYRIRHRATTTTTWGSWSSDQTTTTHTESSLTNGTTYRFEVAAGTASTWGPASAIEATPTQRAAAPLSFTALPGNRSIMLSWTDPNDANITKYQYRYKAGSGSWNPDWTDIAGSGATTTMHTLSSLTNGTTYTVELRASRGTTPGAASSDTATPNVPPGRPSGLSSTAGDGLVDLSWNNPSDSSITKYQYRVSNDGGTTWDPDWTDISGSGAATTSSQVTGLTNDTAYLLQVRAARSGPLYGAASSTTATPRPTTPAAPASFTATAGDGEVELAWTDPSNSQITVYQYRQKAGAGNWNPNWTDITGSSATTTSHTVTPLTNDTTYTFEVRAKAGAVIVGAASSATATPRPTAPPAPSGLAATAGDGEADLSWTDPSDATISKYRYRVSDDGGTNWDPDWTAIAASSATTTTYTVTGLTNDSDYTFELQARRGTVTVGTASSATATPRPTAPPAPTNIRAEIGDGQVTVRWNNPGDSRISVYSHREREGTGPWTPNWTDITGSDANTTSFVSIGLTNDDTYTFEVRARRGTVTYGAASSVSATPRPAAPPAPTGLTADPGNAQVVLSWTDPMDMDISKYEIRQRAGNGAWGNWTEIASSDKNTVTHTVSSLTNNTRYRFEIRSVRGAVTSGAAAGVNVTPKDPPPAPRNLRATPSDGQIVLDWTNPNDATITKYQFRESTDNGASWTTWEDVSGGGSAVSLSLSPLTNAVYSDFQVRAVRGSANAGAAAAIGATPENTSPAAPAGLRATAADTQVTLSWSEGGSTVTHYRVRHRVSGGSFPNTWTTISGRTNTTHTQTGLTNGTAVRFEVAAGTSATTFGPASAIESTPTERPAAPVNLVPHARPASVYLSWNDPNDSAISKYQFRRSTDGGTTWGPGWTDISGSGASTVSHTLSNLANGTTYTIELRAVRTSGTLGAAGQVTATPRTAPSRPTGLTATAGDLLVDLSWNDPGDTFITKYQSRHRADGETNWTDWADIPGATTTHQVTGLTNDTTYTFELRAVRDRDNGGLAASATATPKPPPPPAPVGLTAAGGDREIALSWTAPTPADPRISRYEYRVKRDGQSAWRPDWTEVPGSSASTTSYSVTGLLNDTTYTVEVRAVRGADTAGAESTVIIKTPKPAPVGLIAIAGNAQVELSWTDPGDDEITGYELRRSTDDGINWSPDWTAIAGSDKDTVAHTVSGLTNGTPVTFEVRARGLGTPPQEGVAARVRSTPVDTSSVPAAPADARATAGNARVSLRWTDPQDEAITKYQYRVSADGGATWDPDWIDIDNSGATTISHTVIDLENDITYQIDIRAVNADGDGAVASMIATPKVPVSRGGGGGGGFGGGAPSPSIVDFEWTVERDIEALAPDNDRPTGSWSDGTTLWLADTGQGAGAEVYAYDIATGERIEAREFALAATNRAPRGISSNGTTVWVSDSGRDRLFAYGLATGERVEERDIVLAGRNRDARGIWSGGTNMWVLNANPSLFVYDLESGELLGEYTLHAANGDPRGIWSDGVTVWVSDHRAKRLFAYRLPALPDAELPEQPPALERVADEEFAELTQANNHSPRGIWSDGEVMYVADADDDRVYTYNMPDAIDARLASLELEGVDIGEFDPARTAYAGVAGEGVTATTVMAAATQDDATVAIEPSDADEDAEGHQVALGDPGEVTVTVTSADGSRSRIYRVALPGAAEERWAHCLKGAVVAGFSLLVYEGGAVEELAACAGSRSVDALFALHNGGYVRYSPAAPAFVNAAFTALYAGGVPALTPLFAASAGPPSADPTAAADPGLPWSDCLQGAGAEGFSAVVYAGGSLDELDACARSRDVTALFALHDSRWVSYHVGAPDFVNRAFRDLFPDGLPAITPLFVKREAAPAEQPANGR